MKVVGINLLVFGFLAFLGNFLSIAAVWTFDWGKPKAHEAAHLLPNDRGVARARVHFDERGKRALQHEALIGWPWSPFEGATISFDEEGLRRTRRPDGTPPAAPAATPLALRELAPLQPAMGQAGPTSPQHADHVG